MREQKIAAAYMAIEIEEVEGPRNRYQAQDEIAYDFQFSWGGIARLLFKRSRHFRIVMYCEDILVPGKGDPHAQATADREW